MQFPHAIWYTSGADVAGATFEYCPLAELPAMTAHLRAHVAREPAGSLDRLLAVAFIDVASCIAIGDDPTAAIQAYDVAWTATVAEIKRRKLREADDAP